MHNITTCVFLLLLSSYMFWHCCHPQGAYTKIYLKHAIYNLQSTYICFDVSITVLVKIIMFYKNRAGTG